MTRKLHWTWLLLALPGLAVFLIYLPALGHDFVWDDTIFLRDAPLYRDPALWRQALQQPFVLSPNYFRPLSLLTFMAELRLAGLSPAVFHLTNLLLHACNAVLLTLLACALWANGPKSRRTAAELQERRLLAAGAGLLYGLHPALLESAVFVSSRFDLLLTFFLLLALLAEARLRRPLVRCLTVGGAFLLAALAKEMAVALVWTLPLWQLARHGNHAAGIESPGPARQQEAQKQERPASSLREALACNLGVYATLVAAGLVYLALRHAALGYVWRPGSGNTIATGDPLQHLLLVGRSLMEYVKLVLWPFTTLAPIHHSPLPVPLGDLAAWVSLAAALLLVFLLIVWVRRRPSSGWVAVGGTLGLLPVLNVLPLELGGGSFIAERFLTFPLVFFVLAVAALLKRPLSGLVREMDHTDALRVTVVLAPRQRVLLGIVLLWLFASAATIQHSVPHWRNDMALWTWAARRAPDSVTPLTNLALQHTNKGDHAAGLEYARRALQIEPDHANAWNNAGLALFHLGRHAEAQDAFEQAILHEPRNALSWNNLAGALREQGYLEEAEQILLDKALSLDASSPAAHLNLGIVYLRADRPDLAAPHLQEAARLLPPGGDAVAAEELLLQTRDPGRWLRLGDLLLEHEQGDAALWAFEQAGLLGAPRADVVVGQSTVLVVLEAWSRAEALLQSALQESPDDPRLHNNLGLVARERGNLDAARWHLLRAIELAPDWDLPRQNLADLD